MILGVTGTLGAGKGSVVDYLVEKKGFTHLGVTNYMRSVAATRGITPDRMTFHDIANEHRTEGPTKLLEATVAWGAGNDITDGYVIEALHTLAEVRFVQERGGRVIAVDADMRTRYERIVGRGSEKDQVSFKEFKAHEELELKSDDANKNNIADSVEAADFIIENNGTLEELHAKVDAILASVEA